MPKKETEEPMMNAQAFAFEMGVHYRTALSWLRGGLVPGAIERQTPMGKYWDVPQSALEMEKPKPGPKPKKPDDQSAASPATEEKSAKPAKKARKVGSKK